MDIEKSFTFPFEDKDWLLKLGVGGLITIIPILNFAWSGYLVGIIRNVMSDATEPLPAWEDLGKKFTDGLILFAASLVYALPILIVFVLPLGILASSGRLSELRNLERISAAGVCCLPALHVYSYSIRWHYQSSTQRSWSCLRAKARLFPASSYARHSTSSPGMRDHFSLPGG